MSLQSEAKTLPGGTFTMADSLTVTHIGYGAMQLAGPHVFGPPADRDAAVAEDFVRPPTMVPLGNFALGRTEAG